VLLVLPNSCKQGSSKEVIVEHYYSRTVLAFYIKSIRLTNIGYETPHCLPVHASHHRSCSIGRHHESYFSAVKLNDRN
jgi:hypothetical protein